MKRIITKLMTTCCLFMALGSFVVAIISDDILTSKLMLSISIFLVLMFLNNFNKNSIEVKL